MDTLCASDTVTVIDTVYIMVIDSAYSIDTTTLKAIISELSKTDVVAVTGIISIIVAIILNIWTNKHSNIMLKKTINSNHKQNQKILNERWLQILRHESINLIELTDCFAGYAKQGTDFRKFCGLKPNTLLHDPTFNSLRSKMVQYHAKIEACLWNIEMIFGKKNNCFCDLKENLEKLELTIYKDIIEITNFEKWFNEITDIQISIMEKIKKILINEWGSIELNDLYT